MYFFKNVEQEGFKDRCNANCNAFRETNYETQRDGLTFANKIKLHFLNLT
jgi:hypothetical protein